MIDTEALRKKIIDLAMQGKLTQQLPEDGNAEELYAMIQEERIKLIKEGKIKKEKSLPEISDDEIPFEIPKNWKWVRVADIAFLSSGKPYEETEEGELYIKVSDMNLPENETQIVTSTHFVNANNDGIIPVNSIIFPKRGGAIATNKKRMVLQNPVFVDLNTMGMTVMLPDIFMFVKYWFDTLKLDEIQNGTTIPQVNNKDIYPLILPLPPIEEQKRIVEIIDGVVPQIAIIDEFQQQYESDREILKGKIIDAGIRGKLTEQLPEDGNAEDLYAQIREEKAKLIKEGKIKKEKKLPQISEDEIPFEIPNNWKWVHLFDCGVTQTGNTPSKTHPEYFGNDLSFIGPGDIVNGKIIYGRQGLSTIGKNFGRVCPPGSIMQVCIGGSIGKCAITDKETAFNQQINSLSPIMGDSKYLYYVLCSGYFYGIINHFAAGMATPIINKSSWDSLLVPLPPYKEQKRITECIDEVWSALELLDGGPDED